MHFPWTNPEQTAIVRHRRTFLQAIQRQQPWWLALGTADDAGYTCAGITHPWPHPSDAALWHTFSRGTADWTLCGQALDTAPSAQDWLINIAQAFYDALDTQDLADDWDNLQLSPNTAQLRWIQQWPWNPAKKRWEDGHGQMVPVIPGFIPWAEVLKSGCPQKIGAWCLAPGVSSVQTGLPGPWLIAVLLQTIWLQSVRAGYWDVVPEVVEVRRG